MAAPGRRTDPSLEESLFDRGLRIRVLPGCAPAGSRISPTGKPVGGTAKPAEEIARFGARLSLAFPPSAMHDIERDPDSADPARMTVAFLGLDRHPRRSAVPLHRVDDRPKGRQGQYLRGVSSTSSTTGWFRCFIGPGKNTVRRSSTKPRRSRGRSGRIRSRITLFDLIGMGTDGLRGRMQHSRTRACCLRRPDRAAAALRQLRCAAFCATISACRSRSINASAGWHPLEEDGSLLSVAGVGTEPTGRGRIPGRRSLGPAGALSHSRGSAGSRTVSGFPAGRPRPWRSWSN